MKSLIVPSPEKVKKMLEEMAISVENEKFIAAESEKRGRDLQARCERLSRVLRGLQTVSMLVKETLDDRKRSKQFSDDILALEQACSQLDQQLQQTETTILHIQRQIEATKEKVQRRREQHREKLRQAEEQMHKAKEEKRVAEREGSTQLQQTAQHDGARSAATRRMDSMTRDHENDVKALKTQLASLEAQVLKYHRALLSGIASVAPTVAAS